MKRGGRESNYDMILNFIVVLTLNVKKNLRNIFIVYSTVHTYLRFGEPEAVPFKGIKTGAVGLHEEK